MSDEEKTRMENAEHTGEENYSQSIASQNASLLNTGLASSLYNPLELEQNSESAAFSSFGTAPSLQNQLALDQGKLKRHLECSDDVEEKRQKVELYQFTKFAILAPELRKHVLPYMPRKSLGNYARCSKLCNKDIQIFKVPCVLRIREKSDGFLVELLEERMNSPYESQLFSFSEEKPRESVMEEVENYVIKKYKHIVDGSTHEVIYDARWWPRRIMNIPAINSSGWFRVCMYRTMYDDFVEFTKANTFEDAGLALQDCENVEDQVVLGTEFFEAAFATNLCSLDTTTKYEIDREDFKKFRLHLKVERWTPWLSEAIREKVEAANENSLSQLTITLMTRNDPIIRLNQLFPRPRFQVESVRHRFEIGEFVSGKLWDHGRILYLGIGRLIDPYEGYGYDSSDFDEEDEEQIEDEEDGDGGNIVN